MKLILVRHGNTFEKEENPRFVGSRTDLPLTEFGKKQAENAADYLRKESTPTVVFHGGLKRQSETAGIISKRLGLSNLIEAKELKEIDYGLWENLSAEEIKFMWPEEYKKWTEAGTWPENVFPEKEDAVKESMIKWLSDAKRDFDGQTVLAVTSNGVLRIINKMMLKDKYIFKNSKVRTGAVCVLYVKEGQEKILQWDYLP